MEISSQQTCNSPKLADLPKPPSPHSEPYLPPKFINCDNPKIIIIRSIIKIINKKKDGCQKILGEIQSIQNKIEAFEEKIKEISNSEDTISEDIEEVQNVLIRGYKLLIRKKQAKINNLLTNYKDYEEHIEKKKKELEQAYKMAF